MKYCEECCYDFTEKRETCPLCLTQPTPAKSRSSRIAITTLPSVENSIVEVPESSSRIDPTCKDMITEILSRSTVKTLFKVQTCSREIQTMVLSDPFRNMHCRNHIGDLVILAQVSSDIRNLNLIDDTGIVELHLDFLGNKNGKFLSASNGLAVCSFGAANQFCILNPLLKEHRILPTTPPGFALGENNLVGLAVNTVEQNYRVFVASFNRRTYRKRVLTCMLFSSDQHEWKKFLKVFEDDMPKGKAVFSNMCFHWMGMSEEFLVILDTGSLKWSRMLFRDDIINVGRRDCLFVIEKEGKLCVVQLLASRGWAKFFVRMNEESKKFSLVDKIRCPHDWPFETLLVSPITVSENNVYFASSASIFVYNRKNKQWRKDFQGHELKASAFRAGLPRP